MYFDPDMIQASRYSNISEMVRERSSSLPDDENYKKVKREL
jgi:hypothetical protein